MSLLQRQSTQDQAYESANGVLSVLTPSKSIRRYASEGSSPAGMSKTVKYGGGAVVTLLAAFGVVRYSVGLPPDGSEEARKGYETLTGKKLGYPSDKPAKKTFTGGEQGWVDLKLESVEEINHNTKKFRFALPDKDDVSGLEIACMGSMVTSVAGISS